MDVPAFQDTYGWIEARRGNYVEALTYLRPAAAGLADDPLAQYHFGLCTLLHTLLLFWRQLPSFDLPSCVF